MATITKQTIKVDLTPGRVYPVFHVSQGDVGLEALEFYIYQNNQPYQIPSEVTAINIEGMTPVGVFSYACTWTGNIVTAGVTATMTAERGIDICELALYDATNNKVGTCNFLIAVEESPFTNAHVSDSDMATIMAAASSTQQYELLSKSWAVGDTGIRTGENTNNSEYWAEISESWAVGDTGKRTGEDTNNSEYWSTVSHQYANTISFKTYDTVAQMKADTGLLDGGICRTLGYYAVNDGGAALYKIASVEPESYYETISSGLYAELIIHDFVTPEMYGAYCDGVHDDSAAIQNALNASLENGARFSAKGGKYLVNTGLQIVGYRNPETLTVETGNDINIDFSTSTIIYTGTDYAFTLAMIECGEFKFGSIEAASGGGILMQTNSRLDYVAYLNINGGSISANALKDCITVDVSGSGWANQNKISNIWFKSGLYPTHFICTSTNKINEWIIDNVSLEGVEQGHYLEAHSEEDINIYIRSIKFWYNRGIEHISAGKKFLKTYGRVIGITIYSSYGAFQNPETYEFNYDSSGTTSYSHIANNFDIYAENAKCKVVNGKIIENPYMLASACNITPISEAVNDAGSIYRNYFGTLSDFTSVLTSLYPALLSDTYYANLDNRWLAGTPTDTQSNRQLVQKLTTQSGNTFYRRYKDGAFSDWLMSPLVKTERKVLHQNTFSLPFSAWGLVFIAHTSMDRFSAYLVRFSGTTAPTQVLSVGWAQDWTVTKQSGQVLYFENSQYTTAEMFVAFLQLG